MSDAKSRTKYERCPHCGKPHKDHSRCIPMHYSVQFRMPGSQWAWMTADGAGTMNPHNAYVFPDRESAERHVNNRPGGGRSSVEWRVASRRA